MSDDPVADTLGTIIKKAVAEADEMKKAGAPPNEVAKALEAVVREHWPKGRADEWHLLCEVCSDTGWAPRECPGDHTCGRPKRHGAHAYAVVCSCPKGYALRPLPSSTTTSESAGRVSKPDKWGR